MRNVRSFPEFQVISPSLHPVPLSVPSARLIVSLRIIMWALMFLLLVLYAFGIMLRGLTRESANSELTRPEERYNLR